MKVLLLIFTIFLASALTGCEEGGSQDFDIAVLDLNGDGVADISYEESADGYFEFVDRNFDGRVDVSSFYGTDDKIVSSMLDDNFDGFLETKTWYAHGNPTVSVVDENCDGTVDILFVYENGVVRRSEKYVVTEGSSDGEIVQFEYEFGYPVSRTVIGGGVARSQYYERNKEYFDVSEVHGCK
uniref:hypothetical protein n=1 Tax=Microbulbifer agarilyticus TaxID=260552 RepID=UPI0002559A5D|nr:hypothetical protein [Microbulbifer agarilyticus]